MARWAYLVYPYANESTARPKELMVDYTNGHIYVKALNGLSNLSITKQLETNLNNLSVSGGDAIGVSVAGMTSTKLNPILTEFKSYIDGISSGLDLKHSCRLATTANITLSGVQSIDSVAAVAGNRVLVKNQTDAKQNGIYVVNAGVWARSTDCDANSEINGNIFTFIEEGTVNADSGWTMITNQTVTIGTSNIDWVQFSGAGQVVAGSGISKAGNTLYLTSVGTPGTYFKTTTDAYGRVISGSAALLSTDIPSIDWSKISSGKPTTLAGYGITDASGLAGGTLTGYLTLHADPTQALHPATKQYVDNIASGLSSKSACKLATTANITLSGVQTIDGIGLSSGERVLVKNQTDLKQNGIYIVQVAAWTRSIDFDANADIINGAFVFVEEGTVNADSGWTLSCDGNVVIGTTNLTFVQFSGGGQIVAGTGLSKVGNTMALAAFGTAGTFTKVTVDAYGRISSGVVSMVASDIPALDWAKITTGKPTTLAGYGITDAAGLTGGELSGYLTLHADPTQPMHPATKQYVDGVIQGLDIKDSCIVATTANIVLSGTQTIDGVLVAINERVLVKNQTTATENGIYDVKAAAWVRSADFDSNADVSANVFTFVEEGSANADSGWTMINNDGIIIGSTSQVWVQFSGAGQVVPGVGLIKSGNTLALATVTTASNGCKITYDVYGRVISSAALVASDIPNLDWSKVATGKPTTLGGYGITDSYSKTEIDVKTNQNLKTTDSPTFANITITTKVTLGTTSIEYNPGSKCIEFNFV